MKQNRPTQIYAGIAAFLLAFSTVWFLGCGDDEPTAPLTTTVAIDTVVVDTTLSPLVRSFSVELDGLAGMQIDYWTDAAPRLRVSTEEEETSHQRLVARLLPNSVYQYEVRAVKAGALPGEAVQGSFVTGSLPPALAAYSFSARGSTTSSLTMIEIRGDFNAYVIINDDGQVVWYWQVVGGAPQGSTRRPNGNFAFKAGQRVVEVSPTGEEVREAPGTYNGVHHDVINTPQNTLLFMTYDAMTTVNDTTWVADRIYEWDPEAGTVTPGWDFWDFYSPIEDRAVRSRPDDFSHGNSLAYGPRGNLIVSFNFLNQIISLSPDLRTIEWKLGGIGGDFELNPEHVFTGQHTATEVSEGHILCFDNRTESARIDEWSRAIELRLDPTTNIATKVWSFRPQPDNYARIISSARRLPNGNTLVHFGTANPIGGAMTGGPIQTFEVTKDGTVVWRLQIENATSAYRAEPYTDIVGETIVEAN